MMLGDKIRPIMRRYADLQYGLTELLRLYEITTEKCDVFEETLLFAADVNTQPNQCRYRFIPPDTEKWPTKIMHEKISLEFQGISQSDAQKLLEFLKTFDSAVQFKYVNKNESESGLDNAHCFLMSAKIASKQLLPRFKNFLENRIETNPEKFLVYKELSKNDQSLCVGKIFEKCNNLEKTCTDKFEKEKLHAVLQILMLSEEEYKKNKWMFLEDTSKYYANFLREAILLTDFVLESLWSVDIDKEEVSTIREGLKDYANSLLFEHASPVPSPTSDNDQPIVRDKIFEKCNNLEKNCTDKYEKSRLHSVLQVLMLSDEAFKKDKSMFLEDENRYYANFLREAILLTDFVLASLWLVDIDKEEVSTIRKGLKDYANSLLLFKHASPVSSPIPSAENINTPSSIRPT